MMKTVLGVVVVLVSIAIGFVALLFVVGSGGHAYRLATGAIGLLVATVTGISGIWLMKSGMRQSPTAVREAIMAFAAKNNGIVRVTELQAHMTERSTQALQQIEALCREGMCQKQVLDGVPGYVFASLHARVLIRRCEYCGFEAPLSSQIATCPKCGGTITSTQGLSADAVGLDL